MWQAQGHPDEAGRLFEEALRRAEAHPEGLLTATGDLHVGLADVRRQQGQLDEAARHLETARDLGDRASFIENRYRWYLAAAGLQRARGDLDGAVSLLDQAETLYLRGFFPETQPIPAARARLRIAQGRLSEAWDWARLHEVTPDLETTYLAEYGLLTLVRLLLAQHRGDGGPDRLETALELLDRVHAAAAARAGNLVEIQLLDALARHAAGDLPRAFAHLDEAVSDGVRSGFVRLFLDEGAAFADLALLATARPGREPGALDVLVGLLEESSGPAVPAQPAESDGLAASPGLSEREVEVLQLLATGLTGPEIAQRLFVSVNTLRSHTKHIFTKLGVNSRCAAVLRAAELGLG
jgi:LuxR family maltose regulon positive regulatory protein